MVSSLTYELPYEVNGKAAGKSFLFISEVYEKNDRNPPIIYL